MIFKIIKLNNISKNKWKILYKSLPMNDSLTNPNFLFYKTFFISHQFYDPF